MTRVTRLLGFGLILTGVVGRIYGQPKAGEPIKTTLCELLKSPDIFNGKFVEVRAKVMASFEWGGLVDKSCNGYLLSDENAFPALSSHTGEYAFFRSFTELDHPESLAWKPIVLPPPVRMLNDQPYREYSEFVRKSVTKRPDGSRCLTCPLFEITVTVVGRFDHLETQMVAIRENLTQKPLAYMAGFGHLNASLNRLVWQSVSDVVAVPIDPSVYQE